jgi:hypothetical protein
MISAELFIWLLRFAMLAGLLGLLLALAAALRADLRATAAPAPPPAPPAPPKTAAPTPQRLVYISGVAPAAGHDFPLHGTLDIGRDPHCAVVLMSHLASKHHARLLPGDDGWYLEDLGSTNGTLVNGQPLTAPHRCVPGDRLRIGETEFELR